VLGVPEFVSIIFRANLVDRDPAPLGYQLVNPDQSGKRTQMDLGKYRYAICTSFSLKGLKELYP
jgi:hypothetical protein